MLRIVFISFFFISSCATIIRGSTDNIVVQPTPADSEVWVNSMKVGDGLTRLNIAKTRNVRIEIKHPQCESTSIYPEKKHDPIAYLSWTPLLLGSAAGILLGAVTATTDYLGTRAAYRIKEKNIYISLTCQN